MPVFEGMGICFITCVLCTVLIVEPSCSKAIGSRKIGERGVHNTNVTITGYVTINSSAEIENRDAEKVNSSSIKTNEEFDASNSTNMEMRSATSPRPEVNEPLPLPIMIASPAVAIGIVIFICIAYKWHTAQLDEQAKQIAIRFAADACPSPCVPCSPCRTTQRLIPPPSPMDMDFPLHSPRRKSLRTPTPPPMLLMPPPHASGSRRGSRCSNLSGLSDLEVISYSSPRRHSTFLL